MKKLLVILLLLVVAGVGSLLLLPRLINEEVVRSGLSQQLTELSGSTVRLEGPVHFTVYPDLGITANNVAIGTTGDDMIISAERTVASANLLSLFSGKVKITEIRLDRPDLTFAPAKDENGGASENTSSSDEAQDVFKLAASYLDQFSIDRIELTDGVLRQASADGSRVIASGVNLALATSGSGFATNFSFEGNVDGRQTALEGNLGSLRDLLNRQSTAVNLQSSMSPSPHPLVSAVKFDGNILLAEDGSYSVNNATADLNGNPVRMDVIYRPGERPFVGAKLAAGELTFEAPSSTAVTSGNGNGTSGQNAAADLAFARDMDIDLAITAQALRTGNVTARDISAAAKLNAGKLQSDISAGSIAGGSLATRFNADFAGAKPVVQGQVKIDALDMESLMQLAAVSFPVRGALGSRFGFAFKGLDEQSIRNSFNVKGDVSLNEGAVQIAGLQSLGSGAETISAISARAVFDDVRKPVKINGQMQWKGQNVSLDGSVPLREFLLQKAGPLQMRVQSGPLTGNFNGNAGIDGKANGKLDAKIPSIKQFLAWIGTQADVPVKSLAYAGNIAVSPGRFSSSNSSIALDDTKLAGSASLAFANRLSMKASLSTPLLDLTKFTGGASSSSSGASNSGSGGSDRIDFAFLRGFDADISLNAQQLRYDQITLASANTVLRVQNGIANLKIPRATLYQGAVSADLTANGASSVPAIAAKINLENVNALPLFKAAGGFDRLEGRLNSAIDIKGSGATGDAIAKSLDGTANARFGDGALRGVDIAKLIGNLRSVLQSGYQENAAEKTEFTELAASYNITNGVAATQDLRLLGPLVRMNGTGNVDVGNQRIDMRLNPRVVSSLDGQGGDFDLTGIEIPLLVQGPLSKPRVFPDLAKALQNPQAVLNSLSKLGVNLGKLGNLDAAKLDPKALAQRELDKLAKKDSSGIVGNVIQNLAGQTGGNGSTGDATKKIGEDVVGSLLQGALGNRDDAAAPVDSLRNLLKPQDSSPQTSAPAKVQGDETATLGSPATGQIPVPQPSPRRLANSSGAPAKTQATQNPAPAPVQETAPVQKQVQEAIVEKVLPKNTNDQAKDLLKGVLNQLGN